MHRIAEPRTLLTSRPQKVSSNGSNLGAVQLGGGQAHNQAGVSLQPGNEHIDGSMCVKLGDETHGLDTGLSAKISDGRALSGASHGAASIHSQLGQAPDGCQFVYLSTDSDDNDYGILIPVDADSTAGFGSGFWTGVMQFGLSDEQFKDDATVLQTPKPMTFIV